MKHHYLKIFTCFFLTFSQALFPQIVLQGVITDNGTEYLGSGAELITNALVTIIDEADAQRTFSGYTNRQGHYSIEISSTSVDINNSNNPNTFTLLQNYPNPFNPSTVIGYELNKPSHITIEIYNVLGQKVRTLFDGFQTSGSGQVIWDAADDLGQGVPAGVYIYSLRADGVNINKKMLLIDGQQGSTNLAMSNSTGTDDSGQTVLNKQISDQYTLQVTSDSIETHEHQNLEIAGNMTLDITVNRTVTDIDGNVYGTVKIGDQWWLAENLKVTHYRNGQDILHVTNNTEWINLTTGVYCNYDNDSTNVTTYGRLYNWFAVDDSCNIAPAGWHVPTDEEWTALTTYLGGRWVAGGKIKETGFVHWDSYINILGATNASGFSALPGSCFDSVDGTFGHLGTGAYFWSCTEAFGGSARNRSVNYMGSTLYRSQRLKQDGFSVRLLKD